MLHSIMLMNPKRFKTHIQKVAYAYHRIGFAISTSFHSSEVEVEVEVVVLCIASEAPCVRSRNNSTFTHAQILILFRFIIFVWAIGWLPFFSSALNGFCRMDGKPSTVLALNIHISQNLDILYTLFFFGKVSIGVCECACVQFVHNALAKTDMLSQ